MRAEDSQPEEGIDMVTKEADRGNPSKEPSVGDVELPLRDVEVGTTPERPHQTKNEYGLINILSSSTYPKIMV